MFDKKKEEKETKNKNCEYKFASKKDGDCCRLNPVYDPDTGEMLGCLACEIISDEECKKSRIKTATRIDFNETIQHETIHAEAESTVEPLKIDEVSAAFVANLRASKLEKVLEDIKRSLVVKMPPLPTRPLNKFLINKMRMLKAKIEKGLEDEE